MGGKQVWPTVNVVIRVATAKAAPEKFRATVNSTAVSVVPTRKHPAVAELADAVIPSVDKSPVPARQATDHPAGLNAAKSPALIGA